eukprot:6006290-Pyramimonas_sp.AAC.2
MSSSIALPSIPTHQQPWLRATKELEPFDAGLDLVGGNARFQTRRLMNHTANHTVNQILDFDVDTDDDD